MHGRVSNDLGDWFPPVAAAGLPVPVTEVVLHDGPDLWALLDGQVPPGFDVLVGRVAAAAQRVGGGGPVFLRTGHLSGKHSWSRTCAVPGPDEQTVGRHVAALVAATAEADMFGELTVRTWAVREMLPVRSAFTAFDGMPVAREFRWFTGPDGTVAGRHPYWPPEAIRGPSEPDWRELLAALHAEAPGDAGLLAAMTERAAAAAGGGAWSVDWLDVPGRGWVLIDMAWAERSWAWTGHPTAPADA